MSHICPICQHQFTRSNGLKRHIETVHDQNRIKSKTFECPICHKIYAKNGCLIKHCQNVHDQTQVTPVLASTSSPVATENLVEYFKERDEQLIERVKKEVKKEVTETLEADDETLKKEVTESLKKDVTETLDARDETLVKKFQQIKPSNNVLQVVCIGSNDNYLQMLAESMGDIVPAIEYIKQCALLEVKGDSSLLEKVYQVTFDKPLIVDYNKKKGTVTYYDENKQLVTESHGRFARKIANNLQNCYLERNDSFDNNRFRTES